MPLKTPLPHIMTHRPRKPMAALVAITAWAFLAGIVLLVVGLVIGSEDLRTLGGEMAIPFAIVLFWSVVHYGFQPADADPPVPGARTTTNDDATAPPAV